MTDPANAASLIADGTVEQPDTALILGSGLGELADEFEDAQQFPYDDVPGMPVSTVEGHEGRFVIGTLDGVLVVAMQGRVHFYETGNMQDVVYPVRVLHRLGVERLVVTNAAGGINPAFAPGDLMLITDHINNLGTNPLIGVEDDGPQFPDMTHAYAPELRELAEEAATAQRVELQKGVYVANTGPSYETPAEIHALASMGADAVGMSTVPESIMANYLDIDVLGISLITNKAAGVTGEKLSHDEVIETAEQRKPVFKALLREIVQRVDGP